MNEEKRIKTLEDKYDLSNIQAEVIWERKDTLSDMSVPAKYLSYREIFDKEPTNLDLREFINILNFAQALEEIKVVK